MKIEASKRLASLPPYAFAEIAAKVEELRTSGITPIDFGVGDPSEPTPDFITDNLTELGKKSARNGYPSYIGNNSYRAAAVRYMQRRFGVSLDPEKEICATVGSKEAVFNFPEGFINPGDIVICPSPGYPPMRTGTIFAEGVPYYAPLRAEKGFLLDFETIPESVARRAKIIWINYPNSPTGAIADKEYYRALIDWAHQHEIIIAADEGCYIDIYYDTKPSSILEVDREGIIAFYSLSKRNNMTGYRVGFACGDERLIQIFKRLKTNIDSGVPNIVQDAAALALDDDAHVESMRALYRQKRDILLPALRASGLEPANPAASFYVWQKVPGSDVDFAKRLLDPALGIVVTPGSLISETCEDGTNPGAGYVRFALMPTIEEVHEAARRISSQKFS
ncbi:MAG: aminotransferase class I/II-fold pyridoxal phosphate-dependent enzyme [Candidatus Kaiserbacteria bacterium]|nr:MAG: aminotransferase class I/II-fold pyridoxal phosphate-dependent enzyme [Candidatus Kaiserbacteria bacterium]